ncbi:ankyrin repeat domain-containing protein, putative [Pediculus humanus corporis]|uniref:Ankyrin repeat domain-containing protein, putative n=1 Tax=Pediculus humanus subsp. corporis TaxID=121224 RepID=E0VQL7_PEDHC|nr:ankyrin repeat domain-containing protein, putative [Pediculus humanus corporis]EEB15673.1 ankyrin repeat domain-containing protein, putative [Pediculus humanus corporis]
MYASEFFGMSSDEEENTWNREEIENILKISNLKKKEFNSNFQVSGWEDDNDGIIEESEILWAAENGNLISTKNLLAENSNLINVKDRDGYSPLHRACYNNHPDVVEFLISAGGNIFAKTLDLWQPLHSSCKWNNALCAAKLLDEGADINCKTKGVYSKLQLNTVRHTPLHLAASNGKAKEVLQLLLSNFSLKPFLKNDNNETAYDIAQRSGKYYKIFEIINNKK